MSVGKVGSNVKKVGQLLLIVGVLLSLSGCAVSKDEQFEVQESVDVASQQLLGVKPTKVTARVTEDDANVFFGVGDEAVYSYSWRQAQRSPFLAKRVKWPFGYHNSFVYGSVDDLYGGPDSKRDGSLDATGLMMARSLGLTGGFKNLKHNPNLYRVWLRPDPGYRLTNVRCGNPITYSKKNLYKTYHDRKRLKHLTAAQLLQYWPTLPARHAVSHVTLRLTYNFKYTTDAALDAYVDQILIHENLPNHCLVYLTEAAKWQQKGAVPRYNLYEVLNGKVTDQQQNPFVFND